MARRASPSAALRARSGQSRPRASSPAVSAPRAQMQANAARASGVHPAQQPRLGVLVARARAATASRWWVSTCSIASC